MQSQMVSFFARWFILFSLGMVLGGTLQCCGSPLTRSKTEDGLEVSLEIPSGEDPGLFWIGVQGKVIRVSSEGERSWEISWEPGKSAARDFREGDRLEFLGTDDSARLLVTGEARVGEEKKVTIPLHRVL